MGWLYGIPDVSFINHFVYFKDLLETNYNNTYEGYIRKQQVGYQAQAAYDNEIQKLNNAQAQIDEAVEFIQQVAISERQKELDVVRAYCREINKNFPFTEKEITPETILIDPENFYIKLTKVINEARQGIDNTRKELLRIKANSEGAKQKLSDYMKNDYRYRLNGDITSLLKKMIGTYTKNDEKTVNSYNQKIQEMAIDIVNSTIGNKLKAGEDYAAITVAVLIDIEREAQKMLDAEKLNDFTDLVKENMLPTLEKEYLERLKSENVKKQSAVMQALQDSNSDEFERITGNVKRLLGIDILKEESEAYKKQYEQIKKLANKRNNDTKKERKAVSNIRNKLGKKKKESLKSLTFSKLSRNQAHGTIFELVQSIIEEKGIKAGETAAADVLSMQYNWEIKPNNELIKDVMNTIGDEMGKVVSLNEREDRANEKDLRKSITVMNTNIDKAISELEKNLQELNKGVDGNFFIFHESLKLYSSIETGVFKKWGGNQGFGGRTLNILTYIDFLLSAAQTAGIDVPADRDLLIFLGLNLSKEAIGEGNSEPLVRFFSIFAGLLMFDDVIGMAREAVSNMPKTTVKQVHLYNLNGIYVPSSMVLSYVSDALTAGAQEATYGATAIISSSEAEKDINAWEIKHSKENFHPILGPNEWNEMGSKVASGTKVKIAFMAAFLRLINKLAEI